MERARTPAPLHAEQFGPAAAEQQSRVAVTLAMQPPEIDLIRRVFEELGKEHRVAFSFQIDDAIAARDVLQRRGPDTHLAKVWIEFRRGRGLSLIMTDGSVSRVFTRRLGRSGALDEVTAEELRLVVGEALDVLRSGPPQEWAGIDDPGSLDLLESPSGKLRDAGAQRAADRSNAPTREPSPLMERRAAPQRAPDSGRYWGLNYRIELWSWLQVAHLLNVEAGFSPIGPNWRWAGNVGWRVPLSVGPQSSPLVVDGGQLSTRFDGVWSWGRVWAGGIRMGVGADLKSAALGEGSADVRPRAAQWSFDPWLSLGGALSAQLNRQWRLKLSVDIDWLLLRTRYELATGATAESLYEPWRIRPAANAGFVCSF